MYNLKSGVPLVSSKPYTPRVINPGNKQLNPFGSAPRLGQVGYLHKRPPTADSVMVPTDKKNSLFHHHHHHHGSSGSGFSSSNNATGDDEVKPASRPSTTSGYMMTDRSLNSSSSLADKHRGRSGSSGGGGSDSFTQPMRGKGVVSGGREVDIDGYGASLQYHTLIGSSQTIDDGKLVFEDDVNKRTVQDVNRRETFARPKTTPVKTRFRLTDKLHPQNTYVLKLFSQNNNFFLFFSNSSLLYFCFVRTHPNYISFFFRVFY
jgi:hypothetical protein